MRNSVAKWAAIFLWLGVCSAYADNENAGTPLSSLIQPGFYGRVAIGEGLPPPVVYTYPILITAPTHPAHRAPLYFHVPPAHAKDWKKYCNKYKACSEPVYFVRSAEYVRDKYFSQSGYERDFEQYRYDDKEHGNNEHQYDRQKADHS